MSTITASNGQSYVVKFECAGDTFVAGKCSTCQSESIVVACFMCDNDVTDDHTCTNDASCYSCGHWQ